MSAHDAAPRGIFFWLGRIGVRLWIVNIAVLLVPVAGLEFARIYERQLLDGLQRDMHNQALLTASFVRERAEAGGPVDDAELARVLARAAERTRTRIRVLDATGAVLADSHAEGAPEGPEAPEPTLVRAGGSGILSVSARDTQPQWKPVSERIEVQQALAGDPSARTRVRDRHPSVILFLAEPVRVGGRVDGVVYVTRSTQPALEELHKIRRGLIEVLAVAIVIVGGISLALAFSISRPLGRLSKAASRVAQGEHGVRIPIEGTGEIRELSIAFSAMKDKLDQRLAYISDFAADVAHEFKSPLTSIRGAAELIRDVGDEDPEARQRFLENIELDALRLNRLVTRLLELSRLEASREPLSEVHLETMLRHVAERCSTPDHAVEVDLDRAASTLRLWAREGDLETAIANLVDNAIRFSPAAEPVHIEARVEAHRLSIAVIDRGPGINRANLPRIFERFFTTDAERDGTGLGLAIVRAVAEAHGGRVEVDTSEGGSRFAIVLPRDAVRR